LEQVILRCLDRNPANRPSTALQVAAALPGGDPLAAALAAGETPSPEMVAAAGGDIGYSRGSAGVLVAGVFVGGAFYLGMEFRGSGLDKLSLENPPEVLEKKSREILSRLGYDGRPNDKASGFDYDDSLLDYVSKNDKPQPDWNRILAHPATFFRYWYRQSPQPMLAREFGLLPGAVRETEP